MKATNPNRQPKGQPTGGQFSAKANPEAEVELGAQPTRSVSSDGTERWILNGQLHRDDGPAVIGADGTEKWYQHGQLHRGDGPAVTYPDGTELWWQHGQLHRGDGPAVIGDDGTEQWWQSGQKIDPPTPSPARLSVDAIRGIINDKSLSPDERIAKLQGALGDPVDTDVDAPPGIDYSAKAFRQHFEGDNEIEPLLDGLTDDQIHAAADDYLGSAAADHIWEEYHLAGCEIVRRAASDAARTG